MSYLPLRGLAALALLCLLPRASALTITQTASFNIYNASSGSGTAVGYSPWLAQQFSPSLGTLTGVSLVGVFQGTASTAEVNIFQVPQTYTPTVEIWSRLALISGGNAWETPTITTTYSSAPVTLAPGRSNTIYGSFNHAHSLDTVPLNTFIGGGTTLVDLVGRAIGTNSWGGTQLQGTIDLSLVYTYNVPDAGSALAMFASVLAGLGFLRTRIHRACFKG
jgi:hypothetical protein